MVVTPEELQKQIVELEKAYGQSVENSLRLQGAMQFAAGLLRFLNETPSEPETPNG